MKSDSLLGNFRGLKFFLSIVSFLRVLVPELNLFYEEEIMGFLGSFDLNLLPWIVLVIVLGKQLKKIDLPNWVPPIPVLLFLVSFLVCSLFGWAHTEAEGFKAVIIAVIEYGLGNGCLIAFAAMTAYDMGHGFMKHNWPAFKAKVLAIFRKKEATDGEES